MQEELLILDAETDKQILIREDTLLVFIDETGEEYLKDKNFPVFGLGGCAIPAKYYRKIIDEPWKKFRKKILGESNMALHAAELNPEKTSNEDLNAIGNFFINSPFKRFSAVISEKTIINGDFENYQITASCISNRITEISLQNSHLSNVALFFEHSTSGNRQLKKYFRDVDFKNHGLKVGVERYVANKGVASGLDIADFIMQASGAETRNFISGRRTKRKDFEAIFNKCDPSLKYFFNITRVEETTNS